MTTDTLISLPGYGTISLLDLERSVYSSNPVRWVKDKLGGFLWSKQREILTSIVNNRRTAVQSCYGAGKSYVAGLAATWWIDSHKPGTARVVTSAPTGDQVKIILWNEIGRAHSQGKLPGRLNQTEWWLNVGGDREELVGVGRKPKDYSPSAFQGIHERYVLVILDEACHDDKTDVLTDSGWKRFCDVEPTDKLLTMNPETGLSEYTYPIRLVKKEYTGKMLYYSANGADYCVTPNHKMLVQRRGGNGWDSSKNNRPWTLIDAEDLRHKDNRFMKKSILWRAIDKDFHIIPALRTERKLHPEKIVPMDTWLTFLAWYLSEGHIVTQKKQKDYYCSIGITQSNPVVLSEIEHLCQEIGYNPKNYGCQVLIHSVQLAQHLSTFGVGCLEKRIPRYVSECSPRQISLFLDTYVRGDGYQKDPNRQIIYTSSKNMADDLHELVLKTNVPSTVQERSLPESDFGTHIAHPTTTAYVISRPGKDSCIKSKPENFTEIDYSGFVYCATVTPYHLLFTRRNGHTLWSGNSGIPKSLWEAVDGLLSNEDCRLLSIGNPEDATSEFANECKPGSGANTIQISAFDTPNLTGEDCPEEVKARLVSRIWIEEKKKKWGEENPIYIAKVKGEFPQSSKDSLIPISWVRAAQERTLAAEGKNELGVDVGGGNAANTIYNRKGPVVRRVHKDFNPDTMQTLSATLAAIESTGADIAKVDYIGIGHGAVDRAGEMTNDHQIKRETPQRAINAGKIVGVEIGRPAKDSEHYVNLRAEGYWLLRERFRPENPPHESIDIDPNDEDLAAQLCAIRYKPSAGRTQIESKADMKARRIASPDDADSVMLAFLEVEIESDEWYTW